MGEVFELTASCRWQLDEKMLTSIGQPGLGCKMVVKVIRALKPTQGQKLSLLRQGKSNRAVCGNFHLE